MAPTSSPTNAQTDPTVKIRVDQDLDVRAECVEVAYAWGAQRSLRGEYVKGSPASP